MHSFVDYQQWDLVKLQTQSVSIDTLHRLGRFLPLVYWHDAQPELPTPRLRQPRPLPLRPLPYCVRACFRPPLSVDTAASAISNASESLKNSSPFIDILLLTKVLLYGIFFKKCILPKLCLSTLKTSARLALPPSTSRTMIEKRYLI